MSKQENISIILALATGTLIAVMSLSTSMNEHSINALWEIIVALGI